MSEFNDVNKNLIILMEECSEVIHVCSKALRFGLKNTHPKRDDIPNYKHLEQELGDVIAMIKIIIENNIGISAEGVAKASTKKRIKLNKCYNWEKKN